MQAETNLVQAFQSGDRDAFAELVRRYQNYVASVAYSATGDLNQSEDITQQTFLTAWQKHGELKDPNKLRVWLRGITKNLTRNEYRKQRSDRIRREELSHSISTIDPSNPAHQCISQEQSKLLWSVLENIPESYREPLILFYREGRSVANVAVLMGLSEDNVKQRLSRGRKLVKAEIESFVEDTLFETRPSENFSAAVVAAIPVAGGSFAAKTGGTAIGAAAGAKWLAILAGPLIGVAGAFIGCRAALKSTTSSEEHAFMTRMIVIMTIFASAFVAMMCGIAFFLPQWHTNPWVQIPIWTTYCILLVLLIQWTNRRTAEIKKANGEDTAATRLEAISKPVSIGALRWNAIGASVGPMAVFIILPLLTGDILFFAIVMLLIAAIIYFIWVAAPVFQTPADQIRFNAIVMWPVSISAGVLLLTRWDYWMSIHPTQPLLPGWLVATGFVTFGVFLSWILFRRANRIENEISMSEKDSSPSKTS